MRSDVMEVFRKPRGRFVNPPRIFGLFRFLKVLVYYVDAGLFFDDIENLFLDLVLIHFDFNPHLDSFVAKKQIPISENPSGTK